MSARGFVINNGESLKKLKELLIKYDKKRYDETNNVNIAPAININDLPPVIALPVIAPPVLAPINNSGSCWCRKPDNDDMIFCTFDRCPHGWFHFKCLNLKRKKLMSFLMIGYVPFVQTNVIQCNLTKEISEE